MTYLVIVDTTSDNKIAKMQNYENRSEADAHVARVIGDYSNAFEIDNPPDYDVDYTTVDIAAKTITYDSAAYDSDKVMNNWKESMRRTDNGMPRYVEDILDTMSNKSSVPQITLDKLQAKKDLRATKP